jgi:hypothetical protein
MRCRFLCGVVYISLITIFGVPLVSAKIVSDERLSNAKVNSMPPDIKAAYGMFAQKCSKCHSLARPLKVRMKDAKYWKHYIKKMRRKPGSGINKKHSREIYRFLVYHFDLKKKG